MKKLRKLLVYFVMVLTLTLAMPTNSFAAVKLNQKTVTLIKGQSTTLKIKGTKKKAKWSSSKKNVATVNQKGKVTAKKKGTTIITAKVGSKKYKCKVTVQTPNISKKSITLQKGQTFTLKVNGTNQKVTWKSSNKNIATVSNKGKVTAKKKGSVIITAKVGNQKYKCKVTVKATPVTSPTAPTKPHTPSVVGTRNNPIDLSTGHTFTYADYSGSHTVKLQLVETIENADQIIYEENMFNEVSDGTNRWVLYHYKLNYLSGTDEISASDVINPYYFYNASSTFSIGERAEVATLSGNLEGFNIYDVRLYPGGSSDVWLGMLVDKTIPYTTFKLSWYDTSFTSHEIWFKN